MSTQVGTKKRWKKGLTIAEVEGTLTKLYNPKTEPSKFREGEFMIKQGGEIELSDGSGTIKFNSTNNALDMSYRGKKVTIESGLDGKDKVSGVEYNTYTGKLGEQEELKIGFYAKFSHDGIPIETKHDGEAPSANTVASSGGSQTHIEYSSIDPEQMVKIIATEHSAVDTIVRSIYSEKGLDEETMRAYVSTVFITADRRGVVDRALQGAIVNDSPKPKAAEEPGMDQRRNEPEDDLPDLGNYGSDEDFPDVNAGEDESKNFDYSEFVLPKAASVPEELRGKKFATAFASPGGKKYLADLCVAYNPRGFDKDFAKALRAFCLTFKLVQVASDDKDQVESV